MIQYQSAASLYSQVKESISNKIISGEIKANEKLPSERELCEIYGVSRLTIRQAINELRKEDLVYSVHGKGTYAGKPQIRHGLSNIIGFYRSLLSRGMTPRTTLLYNKKKANSSAAAFLNLPAATKLHNVGILGYSNDQPIVFYDSYFDPEIGGRVSDSLAGANARDIGFTTYEFYKLKGIPLTKAVQTLNAVNADDRLAKKLSVEPGVALLEITSEIYRAGDVPMEYRHAFYNADLYSFHIVRGYE